VISNGRQNNRDTVSMAETRPVQHARALHSHRQPVAVVTSNVGSTLGSPSASCQRPPATTATRKRAFYPLNVLILIKRPLELLPRRVLSPPRELTHCDSGKRMETRPRAFKHTHTHTRLPFKHTHRANRHNRERRRRRRRKESVLPS